MKKNVFGRQFKRDANERKALFRGLMTQLVMHERIETTEEKAKSIRSSIEKLVTKVKRQGTSAERRLLPFLYGDEAVKKMIGVIGPRFAKRPGGYTRIIKTGRRFNDDASMVIMEWVDRAVKAQSVSKAQKKKAQTSTEEKSEETVESTTTQLVEEKGKKGAMPRVVKDSSKPTKAVKAMKQTQAKQKEGAR